MRMDTITETEHENDGTDERESEPDRIAQKLDRLAPCTPTAGHLERFGRPLAPNSAAAGAAASASPTCQCPRLPRDSRRNSPRAMRSALPDQLLRGADASTFSRRRQRDRSSGSASSMKFVVTKIVTPSSRERSIRCEEAVARDRRSRRRLVENKTDGSVQHRPASSSRCLHPERQAVGTRIDDQLSVVTLERVTTRPAIFRRGDRTGRGVRILGDRQFAVE